MKAKPHLIFVASTQYTPMISFHPQPPIAPPSICQGEEKGLAKNGTGEGYKKFFKIGRGIKKGEVIKEGRKFLKGKKLL